MPHREYYGKTARVWNVTKRAVGVELLRLVGNRQRTKKFHVRVEHIRPSNSRAGHLKRIKENQAHVAAVAEQKKKDPSKQVPFQPLKRQPGGPKNGYVLKKRA